MRYELTRQDVSTMGGHRYLRNALEPPGGTGRQYEPFRETGTVKPTPYKLG
jgi:hypothetical protein